MTSKLFLVYFVQIIEIYSIICIFFTIFVAYFLVNYDLQNLFFMKKLKRTMCALWVCILCAGLSSCQSDDEQYYAMQGVWFSTTWNAYYEFYENGYYTMDDGYNVQNGMYSVHDNVVTLSYNIGSQRYDESYVVVGVWDHTMSWRFEDSLGSQTVSFVRQ